MSLEEKFMRATQYVADGDVQLSDNQRTAFYGLQKQAIDGDCNVPAPPSGNKSARSKYDAWNAYRGISKSNAMEKYVAQLKKIDADFGSDGETKPSKKSELEFEQSSSPARILMEGALYKQQDVFKGWTCRYFVLDERFLHYYLQKGDDVPKKSVQVFGCLITSVRSTKVGDNEFFPFVISHPKSTKTYNLSADSKDAADKWMSVLRDAASKDAPPPMPSFTIDRLLDRRPVVEDDDAAKGNLPQNAEMTRANIPDKYAPKVEKAVQTSLQLAGSDEGWSPLFEKDGVKAMKRVGGVVCIRSDTIVPFSLLDIFSLLVNESRQKDFDPSLKFSKRLKYFSDNTFVEHSRYKQVWPNPPRDFCNLVHWRVLSDGSVVFLKFSEKYEDLCPLEEGVVRAELILSAYIFRASSKGTMCTYILQNDLRGNLCSSIVNLISSVQPMCLRNLKRCLEDDANSSRRPALMSRSNKSFAYQDLLYAFESVKSKHSINGDNEEAKAPSADKHAASSSEKIRNAVKTAVVKAADTNEKKRKLHELNTVSLCVLLMPVALYYAVNSQYRAIAFFAGLVFSLEYVFRLHLGIPESKLSTSGLGAVPSGRMLVRFSADLGRLLRYLEIRRESSGVEITVSHIALKAAAIALSENSKLNGHMIAGDFYSSASKDVDVSMSLDIEGMDSMMMKVDHADLKPIDYIADEIKRREKEMKDGKDMAWHRTVTLVGMLPPVASGAILSTLSAIGGKYGITIPFLGIVGFPHGVCTVITIPSKDSSDGEIDVALIPSASDTAAPISITIGGVRLQPVFDQDNKLAATHVLNVAIAVDSNAGSLAEAKKFSARVQQLMNSPNLLDKADRVAAVSREDEKVKAEKAATHAAIFQK